MARIDIQHSRDEATEQMVADGCACGDHDGDLPEIDAQTIPHAVRHAAIFGALESLRIGAGLVLSATHDPVPLLKQLARKHGEAFATHYLEQGPERWRIKITRAEATPRG